MANQLNINPQAETQGAPGPTPGPWVVIEPAAIDYRAPLIYGANRGSLVAVAEGGGPKRAVTAAEARANARLIAAAPDMLAFLEQIEDYLDGREDVVDGDYGVPAPNAEMRLLAELRPLLARARAA